MDPPLSSINRSLDLVRPDNWIRLWDWNHTTSESAHNPLHSKEESNRAGRQPAQAQEDHHDVPQRALVVPESEVEAVQAVPQPALGAIEPMNAADPPSCEKAIVELATEPPLTSLGS